MYKVSLSALLLVPVLVFFPSPFLKFFFSFCKQFLAGEAVAECSRSIPEKSF
jgi:hypothetical protein